MRFTFEVPCKPVGQGNMNRTPYGGMHHANAKRLLPYREAIGWHAKSRLPEGWDPGGPMRVECTFWLPRPGNQYRADRALKATAPWWPTNRRTGDLDHYIRALLDALTQAGIWGDDSQVVQVTAEKSYGPPSLWCAVTRLTERTTS